MIRFYNRRSALKNIAVTLSGLGVSLNSFAINWNKAAFNADSISRSLELVGAREIAKTDQIEVKVPQIAENGTIVPIEIYSGIPETENIYIFVSKNPSPLTASFFFSANTLPFLSTRIKMRESSDILVVIKTKKNTFHGTQINVKVTIGGCGEET